MYQCSMPQRELVEVLIAMSTKTRCLVMGAVADPVDSTYGIPIQILPHDQGGFVVTLDTGVQVYLHPQWIKV